MQIMTQYELDAAAIKIQQGKFLSDWACKRLVADLVDARRKILKLESRIEKMTDSQHQQVGRAYEEV